jgi:hypothetical protein
MSNKDWQEWLVTIQEEFRNNKSSFLSQPNIKRTVHPEHGGMNLYMKLNSEFADLSKIADPSCGKPNIQFGKHSLISIQSGYYISLIKEHFGIKPKDLGHITDIGGGYGYLCYSMHKLGFIGNYNILDFPQMNEMQEYFLSNTIQGSYACKTLKPENLTKTANESLLIGTFSINEMPLDDRKIIEAYYEQYKYIMIAHKQNKAFHGIDNKEYFYGIKKKLSESHNMKMWKCPLRANDHYLIGTRK